MPVGPLDTETAKPGFTDGLGNKLIPKFSSELGLSILPGRVFMPHSNGSPAMVPSAASPSFNGPSSNRSLSPALITSRDQNKDFYQAEKAFPLHPRAPFASKFQLMKNFHMRKSSFYFNKLFFVF